MCRKGFTYSALFFVLIFQLHLAGCGRSDSSTTAGSSFPVIVFTDIHFDPFYDHSLFAALNAADPSQWANIFKNSSIQTPSPWGTDTNYPLLVLTLSKIRQKQGAGPLVIFTGDLLGHNFPTTFFTLYDPQNASHPTAEDIAAMKAFTGKAVSFVLQQVRSSVGTQPVMFVVGNADSYTGLGPDSDFLAATAESFYAQFVNSAVDHQTFVTTFTKGGYYAAELPGLNLMVIGLNTVQFSPSFKEFYANEVTAQLDWFDTQLALARAKGKKVWLLMHVPPGADNHATAQSVDANGHITSATMMWNQEYQAHFLKILEKYPGLITLTLSAHTHMDEYRIMPAGNVADTTPSISPYFGNNPAFKIFTIASATLRATDYTSLNYDLATTPEQFNHYYTFALTYLMGSYLDNTLTWLYPKLAANGALQASYRGMYFSGHTYTIPENNTFSPITDKTWPVYWCGIGQMDEQGLNECVNTH